MVSSFLPGALKSVNVQDATIPLGLICETPTQLRQWTELPVAYVQLKSGATATEAELLAFAKEKIAERAALPKAIHIIPAMPLTGVGKVFCPPFCTGVGITFLSSLPMAVGGGLGRGFWRAVNSVVASLSLRIGTL